MKKILISKEGNIAISSFILGLIVLVFALSTYTVFLNDYHATLSNSDALKAQYLAEAAIEESIMNISESTTNVIIQYLTDLKNYKINYLKDLNIGEDVNYYPPVLNSYFKSYFINEVVSYNKLLLNPVPQYTHEHEYNLSVYYETIENAIYIEGVGKYNKTRKRIRVKVEMPKAIEVGLDVFDLPMIEIEPMQVVSYHQEIFLTK